MNLFDPIEKALKDLKKGKIILAVDNPDRENEGDFICAAEFATTENINFMATYGKGLICMPMSQHHQVHSVSFKGDQPDHGCDSDCDHP